MLASGFWLEPLLKEEAVSVDQKHLASKDVISECASWCQEFNCMCMDVVDIILIYKDKLELIHWLTGWLCDV